MFLQHKKFAAFIIGACVAPALSWAAELQDIQFSELPGARVELRLQFDGEPVEPNGYTIEQPARIVLDFADTDNALSKKKFDMGVGSVSETIVVSSGGRTRLIVNMDEVAPYSTRVEGNALVVVVGDASSSDGGVVASASSAVALSPKAKKNSFDRSASTINDIDFQRGNDGEGKIVVSLTNPNVSIDIEEVASGIEVSFMKTELPDGLNRKLDVTDFATPVKMISSSSDAIRTSIIIEAGGEYDYLAYQADNQYVISVKPLTEAEQEDLRSRFEFTGEKLSLNFQNIEIRNVLQLIADVTELNLVTSDTVKGNITLRLDNVPWDQALELILKTKGLDKRQVGNVLMVAPAAEIAERERQELQTKKQLEELAPMRTEYIRIRYANARDLFDLFVPYGGAGGGAKGGSQSDRNSTGSILSERGQAIVDERTNSIILTDTEEKIAEFKKVIEQVDIPIRQVMIEARIVIANTNFLKELGASLDGGMEGFTKNTGKSRITGKQDIVEYHNTGATVSPPFFDLASNAPTSSNIAWNIIKNNVFLGLELSALEDTGYAEIVSQPKVITGDKQQATIESGTEIPYRDASGGGGEGGAAVSKIVFKKAVLKLDVTPQITPDDKVIIDLVINQDSVSRENETSAGLVLDITKIETQVLVPDGQTVVLGGIFQNSVASSTSKVPFLGDLPFIGRLFRKDINSETKRELLIFITPRIMSNGVK